MGVMAEIAAGLLLYEGPGLLRATTIVLAMEAGAVGMGLNSAARVPTEHVPGRLRRRLHLTLVSLGLAGVFTWAWDMVGGFSSAAGGQGLGLAFLAALPLYLGGSALGLVCRDGARDAPAGTLSCGGPAMLGACTGFLLYGLLLVPRISPPVLVLLCMAALSGAALIHGANSPAPAAEEAAMQDAGGVASGPSGPAALETSTTRDPEERAPGLESDPPEA